MDLAKPSDLITPRSPEKPANAKGRNFWNLALKQLVIFLVIASVAYGTFQFITHNVLQSVEVVGVSMTPTLHDSERYVLNRLVYHIRDPKPQDIVVLRDPQDNCFAVKRIVARQGDTVCVKDGHLFVNGKLLREPYLPSDTLTFPGSRHHEEMWICGVNQYFVLGDNRNNSADSRIYGAVPRENILGMVMP